MKILEEIWNYPKILTPWETSELEYKFQNTVSLNHESWTSKTQLPFGRESIKESWIKSGPFDSLSIPCIGNVLGPWRNLCTAHASALLIITGKPHHIPPWALSSLLSYSGASQTLLVCQDSIPPSSA